MRDLGFVLIGDLARAVGRTPDTIRDWERTKVIPTVGLRLHPNGDVRGQRRVYPRSVFLALQEVADAHGIARRRRVQSWDRSDFPEDAWAAVVAAMRPPGDGR